ncbi:hypothetical protein pdam_00019330 [Pocillopora damicornis]|uniref:Tubulin--tyrosine ligase-like protein 9 n=1 Tax=Pocillopora damicornis TaxID=46731 RepID=A0A3M6U143_POCDA|nr:hypothetical protein pdam_00019330 [Pocillopora damicornis]
MADNELEGEISDNESDLSLRGESECEGEDSGGEDVREPVTGTTSGDRAATPKKSKAKKKKKKWMNVCLTNCKYESVRRVTKRFGMKEVGEDEDWALFWTDCSVALERCMDMKRYQKINHFPGMSEICRKDLLARNMNRLWKQFPKEYAVFPKTWCLPADYGELQAYCRQKKNKTFILKPDSGSQGKGIFLTKNPKDIKPGEHMVCQQYVSKPFLIDGFKFDLRVYVLVTSCDPLRIFVYEDGLGRFATLKYMEPSNHNVDDTCMHLTNYAVNKHSKDFIRDEETGSKRRLTTVNRWFTDNGYDVKEIWASIEDAIIKTLITAHPILKHNYRTCFPNHNKGSACFEILGFDILLDKKLKAWVLEVNHSPSFTTDSPLDKEIKEGLMLDALTLLNFGACDRRKILEEDKKRKWRMQGSKTVGGLPRDPKMVLGQRVLIVEGQEGPRLGRWSNLVDQNLRRTGQEQTDTTKPMTISEEEELERVTSLLQRDNLIRGLGVVEFVYKLLHCTPGTGGPQKNCSLHHSNTNKDSSSKGSSVGGREIGGSLGDKHSAMYGSMGLLSTSGAVAAVNNTVAAQLSRFQTYQPASLSAVMNLKSINQPATLSRNDRRALASVGIVPSAPTGLPKHRYGSRKLSTSGRAVNGNPDYDWRSGSTTGIEASSLAYSLIDPRLDNQPNTSLRRRSLSATGLKTCGDSTQGTRVVNPRVLAAGGVAGSQTNLSSPGVVSPGVNAQQYMCSMYAFPNVLKVAPQPQNGMNLSVISGPAPVNYRPSPASSSISAEQSSSSHRFTGSPSALMRSTKAQRARGATNNMRLKQLELRENHAVALS